MRTTLFIAGALVAAACGSSGGSSGGSADTGAIPTSSVEPPAGMDATVAAVVDGDSLRVEIDGNDEEVRLLGINTPERDECFGAEARTATAELVAGTDTVRLVSSGPDRDQFGRLLRYVYLPDGRDVGMELVSGGFALANSADHDLVVDYKEAEDDAFAAGRGLFAPDACGPAVATSVIIAELEFDAPGPDGDNPDGEWIELRNEGPAAAGLGGWTIRDESSRHRFEFPADFTLSNGTTVRITSGCGPEAGGELRWCAGDAVWSNGGDTAYLLDPAGNIVDRDGY